jgi:hypothetical protein
MSMEDGRTAVEKWSAEVTKLNEDRESYFESLQEPTCTGLAVSVANSQSTISSG